MKYLKDKKILFIAPVFFGYEKDIYNELEKKGGVVTFIGDNKQEWENLKKSKNYSVFSNEYDYLFLIKGEFVDAEVIKLFIEKNPQAERILYQYDSLDRYPKLLDFFSLFDRIYSFDIFDCEKYSMKLRPLFFVWKNEDRKYEREFLYDISSVCSFYPSRIKIILDLKKSLKSIKFDYYVYLHWKSLLLNFMRFYAYLLHIKIKPLSKEKMLSTLMRSKAILDIPFEGQNGLTMRTFETIGLGKKLITTNESIKHYDFYCPNNIFILNDSNMDLLSDFLNKEKVETPKNILDKYSVEMFCKSIFCDLKLKYIE